MPSVQARALTAQHRQELAGVAETVRRQMRALAGGASVADIDAWWSRVEPEAVRLVQRGADAAARLGESYLRRHAALEGVTLSPVASVPTRGQVRNSLQVTGPVGFKTHMARTGDATSSLRVMADRLSGAATRHTMNGERETVMRTFAEREQVAGWRRVGQGDSCPFCLMLQGRGAVYSKRTVEFEAHDSCACTPEPMYRREPDPPEVRALYDEWLQATEGRSGANALRAWREHVEAGRPG